METQTIKRILIPVDFSETGMLALDHGAFMARIFKAELYLLHSIEKIDFPFNVDGTVLFLNDDDGDKLEAITTKKINDLSDKIAITNGIHVIPLLKKGRVVSAVADVVDEFLIDIIVMGTHGAKGFEEYFIGSNAHKTVSITSCPVITIQTHAQKIGFENIVLPIDNSLHSRQKVDVVIELANHYGAKVHILGLINTNEDINENKFNIKIDSVEKALKHAKLAYVRKIVKGKNLAVESMNYSNEIKADLIVIMTDHESNLTGMFLGGFAKQIINHSQIPVMSIKPLVGIFEGVDLSASSNPFG
jgi:nucleotide-binding universal stress UspA family protein